MKTSATILTEQMTTPEGNDRREGNEGAIYALISDGDQVHCMTEGMLDAWWNSLSPADKAEIHEQWLDAELHLDGMHADMDLAVATLRNPLPHIYAAAQQFAADHRRPFTPKMPAFSPAELSILQRTRRRPS